ncbi:MAG: type II toxin-antitoxin system RelE/ParE family toxin [Limnothrix sp.]
MRIEFKNKKLKDLCVQGKNVQKLPPEVVKRLKKVMSLLLAIQDEKDLYNFKGLRFKKLKGERGNQGQYSIRLNIQWRLILTIETDSGGNFLLLIDIKDYH